jgi:hypothetical protein
MRFPASPTPTVPPPPESQQWDPQFLCTLIRSNDLGVARVAISPVRLVTLPAARMPSVVAILPVKMGNFFSKSDPHRTPTTPNFCDGTQIAPTHCSARTIWKCQDFRSVWKRYRRCGCLRWRQAALRGVVTFPAVLTASVVAILPARLATLPAITDAAVPLLLPPNQSVPR